MVEEPFAAITRLRDAGLALATTEVSRRQVRDAYREAIRSVEFTYDQNEELLRAVRFADTRAVSRAAYPHACIEDRKFRDLIDAALGREVPK